MLNKILLAIAGFIIGATLAYIYCMRGAGSSTRYVELQDEFLLDNGGILPKGTLLKVDQAMSEGFTRYILYVNYKSDRNINQKRFNQGEIVPIWMFTSLDTTYRK